MSLPQYIQDLVDLVQEMSTKIDNLENKIDDIRLQIQRGGVGSLRKAAVTVIPDFIPSVCFKKWLQNLDIDKQDMTILLGTNILDGFKCCLIKFINEKLNNIDAKPIWISNNGRYKQIYIYDILDCLDQDAHWRIMTDDDVCILIDIIWRKIIEYYFVIEEESIIDMLSDDEQTQRDINKKILLDMKKRLQRHLRDIQRCIITSME